MSRKAFHTIVFGYLALLFFAGVNCRMEKVEEQQVVIYTSLDKVFSEPVLEAFEKETGIKVLAVYDSEATKTTGLVNRLIAEKSSPRADVFWNSETGRTIILKQKGVLAKYLSPSAALFVVFYPPIEVIRYSCA